MGNEGQEFVPLDSFEDVSERVVHPADEKVLQGVVFESGELLQNVLNILEKSSSFLYVGTGKQFAEEESRCFPHLGQRAEVVLADLDHELDYLGDFLPVLITYLYYA